MRCPDSHKCGHFIDVSFTLLLSILHQKHSTVFVVRCIRVRLQSATEEMSAVKWGREICFAVIYELPFKSIRLVSFFLVRAALDLSKKTGVRKTWSLLGVQMGSFVRQTLVDPFSRPHPALQQMENRQNVKAKRHFLIFQKPNSLMTPTKRMWAGRVHFILRQPNHLAFELWGGKKCEKLPELGVPDILDQCPGDVWILRIRGAVIEWALTTGLHLWWYASKHWIRKKKWRIITSWLMMTDEERKMPSAQLIPYTLDFVFINIHCLFCSNRFKSFFSIRFIDLYFGSSLVFQTYSTVDFSDLNQLVLLKSFYFCPALSISL